MKPYKPVLNQTLYSLNIGNAYRKSWGVVQELTLMRVSKVGRKYFTLVNERGHEVQFHIDDWSEKTEYCRNHELYESPQVWEDKKESEIIYSKISPFFERLSNIRGISLSKLKQILKIIEAK